MLRWHLEHELFKNVDQNWWYFKQPAEELTYKIGKNEINPWIKARFYGRQIALKKFQFKEVLLVRSVVGCGPHQLYSILFTHSLLFADSALNAKNLSKRSWQENK